MTDTAIVIATRAKGNLLRLVCPYCERVHIHGDGGDKRLQYHRLSHCPGDHQQGYTLVVLDETSMTERAMHSLFSAMDDLALAARADDPLHSPFDDQVMFRRLQKQRHPDLTREQWLDLFAVWQEHFLAKLETERNALLRSIDRVAPPLARALPHPAPFTCVCGATGDPNDPAFAAIHAPHIHIAGLDDIDPKSLVRWRVVP